MIGFDGIALGEQLSPSLASVVQPIALMGTLAIDSLLNPGSETHLLPHHLRLGKSIAPAFHGSSSGKHHVTHV